MLRNISIRTSITLVIAVFFAMLAVASAAGVGALKQSNDALREMYENDTSALISLKSSDELLQHARVSLDSYMALYGVGDPEPELLAAARSDLAESDRAFGNYLALQSQNSESLTAATELKQKRLSFIKDAVLPSLDA